MTLDSTPAGGVLAGVRSVSANTCVSKALRRSASGKGAESEWPAYKRLGVLELQDLEDGVNYLKSLPYIDGTRIGISGWSYGGFMTSYALTHSNAFKIGIAGGTVSDWSLYDSIYTERYMMTPQNNPEGYRMTSVTGAAKNLSGKLLLVHGATSPAWMGDNGRRNGFNEIHQKISKPCRPTMALMERMNNQLNESRAEP